MNRLALYVGRAFAMLAACVLGGYLSERREPVSQIVGISLIALASLGVPALLFGRALPVPSGTRVPHARRRRVYRWGGGFFLACALFLCVLILSPPQISKAQTRLEVPAMIVWLVGSWIILGWYCIARDEDRESALPPPVVWFHWHYSKGEYQTWAKRAYEFADPARRYLWQKTIDHPLQAPETYADSRGLFAEGEYLRWPPGFVSRLDSVSAINSPAPRHLLFIFSKRSGGGQLFPMERRVLIPSDNAAQVAADLLVLRKHLTARFPETTIAL